MAPADTRKMVTELATRLLEVIRPGLQEEAAGTVVGEAKSGDYTFAVDEAAENALESLIDTVSRERGVRLAYYSEDRGLVQQTTDPQYVLIIDPIDGTRPAMCGLENCCISVALAPLHSSSVALREVEAAALLEIKTGNLITARKGEGVAIGPVAQPDSMETINGSRLSQTQDLNHLFWAFELCARPTQAMHTILSPLIDKTSFGGGAFVFNSSSYAISRLVTGQLQAYIDPFAALLHRRARDDWERLARSLYGGKVFGLFAYDIAAAAFIAAEAGAVVTDAAGHSLAGIDLLRSGEGATLSCVAASNAGLHAILLKHVQEGMERADSFTFPA